MVGLILWIEVALAMTRFLWLSLLLALLSAPPAGAQVELARALSRLPAVIGEPVEYPRDTGESTYQIARSHGVGTFAVRRANRHRPETAPLLLPTQHIAPRAQAEGLVINLPEHAVYLYRDGRPVKVFPVAIGRAGFETPTGSFEIINKAANPTWFPPRWAKEEAPVPPGPDNPLGDRWIGLSAPGIGLHATTAPTSVGRNASHGCMRMYPEHAHELYDNVTRGLPAEIIYQLTSIGYRPEDGIVYLAHFPNTYEWTENPEAEVSALLDEYGLSEVVDEAAVADIIAQGDGVAVPIVGSRTRVTIGGRPIAFALGPIRVNGEWLVPVGPLADAMGARYGVAADGRLVTVQRGVQQITFTAGATEALLGRQPCPLAAPMRLAAGYPLVPLRAVTIALGASVGWDAEANTVLIWDQPGALRQPR
jgi:L,D-transpeptidase ErfK/SrfK